MEQSMMEIKKRLEQRISVYAKEDICLAFSGGVDSSLLLKVAAEAAEKMGKTVYAVTFDSRLHPSCDLEIAARVAKELGGVHRVVSVNELEQKEIRFNPVNRCYLCKKKLFRSLKDFAGKMNIPYIMDGTNEDDLHVYRPGIKALRELGIISPLAELHITKAQVKALASWYGISVASRPSAPCMATRLPYNTEIDYDILNRIGRGEEFVSSLVKGNVRLRLHKDIVRIEVDREAMGELMERSSEIVSYLKELGFSYITMDLEGFRSGSMDVGIEPLE
ncbi:ATP-dependent sacrificial sulfur transferase LarE [Lacrimispora saccharolytica]|uniref:Asparagine synthase n=1 Tax=Lacrimispora saccharolytica (strain ATCC 35040 / DSM 2544 / NRCC 2533 / WM1) TaxID=610130 RepID=D9R7T2_LACSW|nr:ATP-dependent sacrificial sulfur transferase LarE [Lacrimispora saccharolytica]ADL05586.1 asparagine synthase [[Clostridium] saccharolyticum WM1]